MEHSMTLTEAFTALGVSPALVYVLSVIAILLLFSERINEAAGLSLMLLIPYVVASNLTGQWIRTTLYIPLIGAVLSVVFVILPVTFIGREKYDNLIREKLPKKNRNIWKDVQGAE